MQAKLNEATLKRKPFLALTGMVSTAPGVSSTQEEFLNKTDR